MVVGALTVDRVGVELEVAGVDDGADRGLDPVPQPVDHGMRHAERLDAEGPEREGPPGLDGVEPRLLEEPVLAQPLPGQGQRHPGPEDGHVQLPEEVRQGADVVLVGVGEDDAPHLLPPRDEVGEVRNDVVDPGQLVVGEHEAAVDAEEVLAAARAPSC